jgi:hypothetical protein
MSGGQKTPPFCTDGIEDILIVLNSASIIFLFWETSDLLNFNFSQFHHPSNFQFDTIYLPMSVFRY